MDLQKPQFLIFPPCTHPCLPCPCHTCRRYLLGTSLLLVYLVLGGAVAAYVPLSIEMVMVCAVIGLKVFIERAQAVAVAKGTDAEAQELVASTLQHSTAGKDVPAPSCAEVWTADPLQHLQVPAGAPAGHGAGWGVTTHSSALSVMDDSGGLEIKTAG